MSNGQRSDGCGCGCIIWTVIGLAVASATVFLVVGPLGLLIMAGIAGVVVLLLILLSVVGPKEPPARVSPAPPAEKLSPPNVGEAYQRSPQATRSQSRDATREIQRIREKRSALADLRRTLAESEGVAKNLVDADRAQVVHLVEARLIEPHSHNLFVNHAALGRQEIDGVVAGSVEFARGGRARLSKAMIEDLRSQLLAIADGDSKRIRAAISQGQSELADLHAKARELSPEA